jgi:hypothetical protein
MLIQKIQHQLFYQLKQLKNNHFVAHEVTPYRKNIPILGILTTKSKPSCNNP